MPRPFHLTKRGRYNAIFETAALELVKGKKVFVRPEGANDWRTIQVYWYDFRKVYHGQYCKSPDPETRRRADVILNTGMTLDTDKDGGIVLRLETRITPGASIAGMALVEEATVKAIALSTPNTPQALDGQATAHFEGHTQPWKAWFLSWTDFDGMFTCLNIIPREMRANPDLASLEDLPAPDSAEGAAWKQRFKESLT